LEAAGTMEPASVRSWQRIEEVTAWWSGAQRTVRAAIG
jgi:hypothetical protein